MAHSVMFEYSGITTHSLLRRLAVSPRRRVLFVRSLLHASPLTPS